MSAAYGSRGIHSHPESIPNLVGTFSPNIIRFKGTDTFPIVPRVENLVRQAELFLHRRYSEIPPIVSKVQEIADNHAFKLNSESDKARLSAALGLLYIFQEGAAKKLGASDLQIESQDRAVEYLSRAVFSDAVLTEKPTLAYYLADIAFSAGERALAQNDGKNAIRNFQICLDCTEGLIRRKLELGYPNCVSLNKKANSRINHIQIANLNTETNDEVSVESGTKPNCSKKLKLAPLPASSSSKETKLPAVVQQAADLYSQAQNLYHTKDFIEADKIIATIEEMYKLFGSTLKGEKEQCHFNVTLGRSYALQAAVANSYEDKYSLTEPLIKTVEAFQKAVSMAYQHPEYLEVRRELGFQANKLAKAYQRVKLLDKAAEYFELSIEMYESVLPFVDSRKLGVVADRCAHSHGCLSTVFHQLNEEGLRIPHLLRAAELYEISLNAPVTDAAARNDAELKKQLAFQYHLLGAIYDSFFDSINATHYRQLAKHWGGI